MMTSIGICLDLWMLLLLSATIKCQNTPTYTITIGDDFEEQWPVVANPIVTKDKTIIEPNDQDLHLNVTFDSNSGILKLRISPVKIEDRGKYMIECVDENQNRVSYFTFKLDVEIKHTYRPNTPLPIPTSTSANKREVDVESKPYTIQNTRTGCDDKPKKEISGLNSAKSAGHYGIDAVQLLAQNTESKLIKNVLDNYITPTARPVRDHSKNVTVILRLIVTHIIELNERRQEITVSGWYTLIWKDEFMTWDPEEYDNVTEIYIHRSALWNPDVTLYNNVDDEFQRTSLNLKVKNDGEVELATPTILKSFCKMNMKYFPLDEQKCDLEFAGWIYHGGQQDVVPDTSPSSKHTEFNPNSIWNLHNVSVEYIQQTYSCCPEVYPKVVYTLVLKRRERFFVEVILLPCCLLSALTMFVFLLPPESDEKMSFGVATLLAIILYQQMIAEALPPSADSTPIIQTYFTMLICTSCFSIICTVFVLNLYNRGQTNHEHVRDSNVICWRRIAILVDRVLFIISMVIVATVTIIVMHAMMS